MNILFYFITWHFGPVAIMDNLDTGNIEHKKVNKNALNNGQSRDTCNIEHKKANKNEDKQNKKRNTEN
jgi:hypothetical protein